MIVDVPVHQRAHPLSIEYRVEALGRDCFDMLELRMWAMFDILRHVESAVASDAAYRVSLRIREREHLRNWRKWLPIRPDDRLFPGSIAVATRVIEEIERRAGKPLGDLADAELRPYQRRINDIMDERARLEYPDPDGAGERALEELRRDYGRAVA